MSAVPRSNIVEGSGTDEGVPTSLPTPGTFWNLTKIALQICVSLKPAKLAPLTVNDALSPGASPSFGDPPAKLPDGPVVKPKSSTTLLKPAGRLPRSPSEKLKVDPKLGACEPVNPLRPELLALPSGGKSKPMPVIVEVDPGDVMFDVLVMVKVSVLVCASNVQTTEAVDALPLFVPLMMIGSACAVAETTAKTVTALKNKQN